MTGRRAGAIAAFLIGSILVVSPFVSAQPVPPKAVPLPPEAFAPIVLPAPDASSPVTAPSGPLAAVLAQPRPIDRPPAIADFARQPFVAGRRPVAAPEATRHVLVKARPKPRLISLPRTGSARRVSGSASWYCKTGVSSCHYAHSSGLYAAAGPALRVGDWRGRRVQVCAGSRCVTVTLIDWCQCYGTRVIDLYSDAFRLLKPLSSGVARVTVRW